MTLRVPSSIFYAPEAPATALARERDAAWFKAHPQATWRVRPILEGESPLADGMRARDPAKRAYAIVIDHARARDRCAVAGRVVYPVLTVRSDREDAKRLLAAEGERWARWFRKHASTPPPTPAVATFREVAP